MSGTAHRVFISFLVAIVFVTLVLLIYKGMPYYRLSLEDRVYHSEHSILKPSGTLGHGIGIAGSLFMIVGMASYMARKRYRSLSRLGLLKHWLEFHIFLCTLGPLLILFHTAYKFGGLVAVSFWSMTAVFLSGIIGRFIYIRIPRNIEGHELTLNEIQGLKTGVADIVRDNYNLDEDSYNTLVYSIKRKVGIFHKNPFMRFVRKYMEDHKSVKLVRDVLKKNKLPDAEIKTILVLVKNDIKLNRRIEQLDTMQNLFKYWHVAHLPFALVMLVIMVIHVGVTILFGYRWIF